MGGRELPEQRCCRSGGCRARGIKKIALARPQDHDLPFSTWSLSKLAEFLVAEGGGDLHGRVRAAEPAAAPGPPMGTGRRRPRQPGRAEEAPPAGDLQVSPTGSGTCWPGTTCPRDRLYGHVVVPQGAHAVPGVLPLPAPRCYPPEVRIAIVLDNFTPHLSTRTASRVGTWAAANNVELTYVPSTPPGLTGSRPSSPPCATSPSTAPTTPITREQASMIRRYIAWRNRHAGDKALGVG